jgi:fused signal recognition particle receptor
MELMYRKITMFGMVLTLSVITAGSLAKILGIDAFIGEFQPHQIHVYGAYALAGTTLAVLLLSGWQTHCRVAAITASLVLAGLLAAQIVLGVKLLKAPEQVNLITGHLLLAMAFFWQYFWLYLRSDRDILPTAASVGTVWFARFGMLLLLLQITLGSWVSVNHATFACTSFPQCNGQWWPQADYQGAFTGLITGIGNNSNEAQIAMNWLHRVVALVCFILLNGIMLIATNSRQSKAVRTSGLWLSFLLFVQVALGVIGFRFAMPTGLVLGHSVFAAILMLPLISISFYSRYGAKEALLPPTEKLPEIKTVEVKPEQKLSEPKSVTADLEEPYTEPAPESIYLRLKLQLARTRTGLGGLLANLPGHKKIDADLLEEIEASLLMADVGIDVTTKIINRLTQSLERQQLADSDGLTTALKQELRGILAPCSIPLQIPKQNTPFVILVVGVNGVGKTTTIGKLAKRLKAQGHSVMLAAGDTFRAAAVEQLQTWGQRNNIHVVAQHTGADSASVIYDGIQSAQSKGVDVLIADTAGRLHTKSNLMEELKKVKRIMAKLDEAAPHEVILVLDAGTGQNALSQAKLFNEAIGLTGLVLTKLDGTAKGGVIFALAKQSGIPIRFIGVGEGIDDLQDFNAETFVDALFVKD